MTAFLYRNVRTGFQCSMFMPSSCLRKSLWWIKYNVLKPLKKKNLKKEQVFRYKTKCLHWKEVRIKYTNRLCLVHLEFQGLYWREITGSIIPSHCHILYVIYCRMSQLLTSIHCHRNSLRLVNSAVLESLHNMKSSLIVKNWRRINAEVLTIVQKNRQWWHHNIKTLL